MAVPTRRVPTRPPRFVNIYREGELALVAEARPGRARPAARTERRQPTSYTAPGAPWQRLYFLPEPQ
jgi:hypothetical protein